MSNLVLATQNETQVFKYEVDIEANSEEEADLILDSLLAIQEKLKPEDLAMIADFIEQNPQGLKMIKEWIKKPPPFVQIAIKTAKGLGF